MQYRNENWNYKNSVRRYKSIKSFSLVYCTHMLSLATHTCSWRTVIVMCWLQSVRHHRSLHGDVYDALWPYSGNPLTEHDPVLFSGLTQPGQTYQRKHNCNLKRMRFLNWIFGFGLSGRVQISISTYSNLFVHSKIGIDDNLKNVLM